MLCAYKHMEDPKRVEITMYLVQFLLINSFYFFWFVVGSSLVYDNRAMITCMENSTEVLHMVGIGQILLIIDFFIILISVMLFPMIMYSFFKVLRQRWRIAKYEKNMRIKVSKEQHN
jgi:hypothetical protein